MKLSDIFDDPDDLCQTEQRAIITCVAETLEVDSDGDIDLNYRLTREDQKLVRAILQEFKGWAEDGLERMAKATRR